MKLWIQSVVGFAIGIVLAYIPGLRGFVADYYPEVVETMRIVGRFVLSFVIVAGLPLSMIAAVQRRQQIKNVASILILILVLFLCGSFFGYLVGVFFVSDRLPPQFQSEILLEQQTLFDTLQQMFPANGFELLLPQTDNVLPLCVAAILIACLALTEKKLGKNSVAKFLELSWYAVWQLLRISTTVCAGFLIVLGSDTVWKALDLFSESVFTSLFLIVALSISVIIFGILPLLLNVFRKENMYRLWITSIVPPMLFALSTGDVLYSLPSMYRSTSESFSFPHPMYSSRLIASTLLFRLGTVFVVSLCCIVILRSYSALTITFTQTLIVILGVPFFTILLFNNPYNNFILVLASIAPPLLGVGSSMYFILYPMLAILQRLAAALDCAGVMFVLVLKKERVVEESRETSFIKDRHFVLNRDG